MWARNAEAVAALTRDEAFVGLRAEIRQVYDAEERIPYPGWRRGGFYYDFWRDGTHPRGIWRRTTLDQYRRPEPNWDVLDGLKFVAALPRHMATATLAARLADLDAAAVVLSKSVRLSWSDGQRRGLSLAMVASRGRAAARSAQSSA